MMRIYREEKVNPMGGCFPILIQIPVFMATCTGCCSPAWKFAMRPGLAGFMTCRCRIPSSSCPC
ncbi:YidC/Oxa1 family membrane protein insertase [Staphylococcus epidermidis]|nr:YidC/Oxa1 family membrane protein insertase [Staphylococcus epidermidis]